MSLKTARKNKERRGEWKPLISAGNVVILKMKQLPGKEIGKKYPCVLHTANPSSKRSAEQRRPAGTAPCEGFAAGNDILHRTHTVQRLLLLQLQMWLKNPRRRPIPPQPDYIFYGLNIIAIKGTGEMGHEGYLKLPNSFETNNRGHARSLRKETRRPSYLSLKR